MAPVGRPDPSLGVTEETFMAQPQVVQIRLSALAKDSDAGYGLERRAVIDATVWAGFLTETNKRLNGLPSAKSTQTAGRPPTTAQRSVPATVRWVPYMTRPGMRIPNRCRGTNDGVCLAIDQGWIS